MLYQLSYARGAGLNRGSGSGDASSAPSPGPRQALRDYGSGEMTSYR